MARQLAIWLVFLMALGLVGAGLVGCGGEEEADTEVAEAEPGEGEEYEEGEAAEETEIGEGEVAELAEQLGAEGAVSPEALSGLSVDALMAQVESQMEEIPEGQTFKDVIAEQAPGLPLPTEDELAGLPEEIRGHYQAMMAATTKDEVLAALRPVLEWSLEQAETMFAGAVLPVMPGAEELPEGVDLSDERIFGEFDPDLRPEYMTTIVPGAPVYLHKQVFASAEPAQPAYGTHIWPKNYDYSVVRRVAVTDQDIVRMVEAVAVEEEAPEEAGPTEGEGEVEEEEGGYE